MTEIPKFSVVAAQVPDCMIVLLSALQLNGVNVKITTQARTVADCFKHREKSGLEACLEGAVRITLYRLTAAVLGLLLLGVVDGVAGKLDAFEEGVQEGPSCRGRHRSSARDDAVDSCLTDAAGELLVKGFGYGLMYGGIASWGRVAPFPGAYEDQFPPREPGSPLIPFARVDISYQDVESDVEAMDYRVEGGYGPVGVHFDYTHYRESLPSDALDLYRLYGLYRMSLGTMVEVDLGFGALTIRGDDRDRRFSFTVPVLIHPTEWMGIEIRPAWAEDVTDVDVALLLTLGPSSLKAGYRWIENPLESLNGPYAGVSVHF